jgi:hypothetical protein
MKKRIVLMNVLLPLVFIISLYLVFYSKINCKPNHVGFWFILGLGISIGVSLTRFILWFKEKDNK